MRAKVAISPGTPEAGQPSATTPGEAARVATASSQRHGDNTALGRVVALIIFAVLIWLVVIAHTGIARPWVGPSGLCLRGLALQVLRHRPLPLGIDGPHERQCSEVGKCRPQCRSLLEDVSAVLPRHH